MSKYSDVEIQTAKRLRDAGYKWIARYEHGLVCAFAEKPYKGDANGVNYNMETAKFLSVGRPTELGAAFTYTPNTYITEEITSSTLSKLINYLSQDSVNFWSLRHNCALVAADGWNSISNTKVSARGLAGWHMVCTPAALRDNLRKISGHAENWKIYEAFK